MQENNIHVEICSIMKSNEMDDIWNYCKKYGAKLSTMNRKYKERLSADEMISIEEHGWTKMKQLSLILTYGEQCKFKKLLYMRLSKVKLFSCVNRIVEGKIPKAVHNWQVGEKNRRGLLYRTPT